MLVCMVLCAIAFFSGQLFSSPRSDDSASYDNRIKQLEDINEQLNNEKINLNNKITSIYSQLSNDYFPTKL